VIDRLKERLLASRLILPDEFFAKADQFTRMLLNWNKVHNLTGAKHAIEVERHIYDSVYPLVFLEEFRSAIDIGSGAGFPALMLAMAKPQTLFTLVEPLIKRASFLQFAARALRLDNVSVADRRIEQMPPIVYELITSRAVGRAKTIYDLALPFMDSETILLLYKGKNTAIEAESIGAEAIKTEHAVYLIANRH
jgi:16S rRNA (guanine527-N7)-methyltransferase